MPLPAGNDKITTGFIRLKLSSLTIVLLPMLAYFALIKIYGVNAPWFDDLRDILQFMLAFDDADAGWDKFVLLFKQHNQHRTAVSHVIYLLQYHLFGQLNFVWLMLLANIAPLAIVLAHYYLFRSSPHKVLMLVVASLLIFQPHAFYTMFWAMAALSAYLVLAFAYWSFVCLERGDVKGALLAGLFAGLAIFTNSNGIFLPVAVMLVFGLRVLFSRESMRDGKLVPLGVYLLCCALCLLWFFHDYDAGPSTLEKFVGQFQHLHWLLINFCWLVGSGYSYENFYVGAVIGGFGLLLILCLLVQRYFLRRPALFGFLVFLLLSLAAVAVVRGQVDRPKMLMSSHYYQLSMHIWVIIAIAFVDLYWDRLLQHFKAASLALVVSLGVFCIVSYVVRVPEIVDACVEKKSWIYELNKKLLDGSLMRSPWDKIVLDSLQRGYFDPNPGLKEYPLPFLSAEQSCYIGGWK